MSIQARGGYVYQMKRKSETFEKFKEFRAEIEDELGKRIKAIRFDRGGEYLLGDFKDYLTKKGIIEGKSGFVSHTKLIAEATFMVLFHS